MRIVATLVGNLYDVDVTVTPEEDHTDAVNAVAATMVGVGVGIAPGLVGADGNPIERDEFWTWFMAAVVRAGYVLAYQGTDNPYEGEHISAEEAN